MVPRQTMRSLSFLPSSVNIQIPQFQFRPRRSNINFTITALSATTDTTILHHAAKLADSSAGHTSPHPNFACVITKKSDRNGGDDDVIVGEGYLYAQGTKCAELQAVEMAGEMARGSTAYLNMEAGDCYGDFTPVSSLLQAGISRVVVGIRHPLQHLRGEAIRALRSEGVQVDVLGEELQSKIYEGALKACLDVNAPLLYRSAFRVPFSVLKYAMTLDGKIATSSGHASWVSSKDSRHLVLQMRGRSDAVIVGGNTVYAFIAPKIIGGVNAPTPVGDLGMIEMSQAKVLIDPSVEQVGPDILVSGFLQPIPDLSPGIPSADETSVLDPTISPYEANIISFYKTWDQYGALSNFSPHPLEICDDNGDFSSWPTVEHYYQANKFEGIDNPLAKELIQQIRSSKSPEEAARLGRKMQKQHPDLVRPDWDDVKIDVMYKALKCKFSTYEHLRLMLRSTAGSVLVEASPHDLFWGGGREGEGLNYLGRLLMKLRSEILEEK